MCRLGLAVSGGHTEAVGAWSEELEGHRGLEEGGRDGLSEGREQVVFGGRAVQCRSL